MVDHRRHRTKKKLLMWEEIESLEESDNTEMESTTTNSEVKSNLRENAQKVLAVLKRTKTKQSVSIENHGYFSF